MKAAPIQNEAFSSVTVWVYQKYADTTIRMTTKLTVMERLVAKK